METPYKSPASIKSADDSALKSKRFFWRATLICAFGVVVPTLLGVVGTAVGVIGAYKNLSKTGNVDPALLADDVSFALLTTFWGLIFSTLSLIPFIIFLVLFLKSRKTLKSLT